MDAENDNDKPNSSSASASSSSSNNSSSSNLLGHLPMLPFMRSTDDDEQEANEADGNDNVNDLNEEPMPLQPPITVAMASAPQPASASVQQPTMAPITTTASVTGAGTSTASSTSVGRGEPMQQAPPHQASSSTLQTTASIIESATSVAFSSPSSLLQTEQQEQSEQQLTAQINLYDIADTIDASAVIVQPLEANAEIGHQSHLYPQEAASSETQVEHQQNNTQLDANDNNGFDVDLNARNDEPLATTSNAVVAVAASSSQQPQTQQQSLALDTSVTGSTGLTSSTSTGQPQTSQPPTTLPLFNQQQETVESNRVPSFDHHYHNPREFHLHAHPYQHPCVYPYGLRSSISAQNNNNTTKTSKMICSNMQSYDHDHDVCINNIASVNKAASSSEVVDRIKMLYPNVDESETPLPRCWSAYNKCLTIGLSENNLRAHFKTLGKPSNDAASVRTDHPIPPTCGIYYFEVKIISKGKNGYMGIGLTCKQFRMNRLPGWDKQSFGYHGDDGNSFASSGHGQSYGPTFSAGDTIGCCLNFVNNTCFYTKNGIDLGVAFRDLPPNLYPTVGLQTPGEEIDANFGQKPFKFDQIEDMMKQLRAETKAAIYDFPLPADQGDPTILLQKMVSTFLVHNGYSQTAEAFARQQKTGQSLREDIASIRSRQKILKLIMSGKMGQAIEQTMCTYPGLLENNKNLLFLLKCRQFIEMINGTDIEYGPSSSTPEKPNTIHLITPASSVPQQTSVIQSTKSYQNCNDPNNSSKSSITTDSIVTNTTGITTATATTSNTTNNSSNNIITTATVATITTNAQNSSHIAVIHTDDNDLKTQSNLVEHCSASNDAPSTISKSNNDSDYLNDVEMENNGHTTNGNVSKNGNSNIFNESMDADDEMEVDDAPTINKYGLGGIERILEFGKHLSQLGLQLEKEEKMTDGEKQMLENAFSLIAYSNPWASPLGWQLCPTKRENVCRALNSAILESMNYTKWPPLEYCVAHANELLKIMGDVSLGACAFVSIADVFPKN